MKAHRLGLVVMITALALSAGVAPAMAAGESARGIQGDYRLDFHWHGAPGFGSTGLHIFPDGTFNTDDGSVGHWRITRQGIDLQITVGCRPLYVGHRAGPGLLRGRQLCTDGSGGFGRWRAKRIGVATGSGVGTSYAP